MNHTFQHNSISSSILTLESARELFTQDEVAGAFYVVLSGTADMYRNNEMFMRLGPDSVLGAEPLFTPGGTYLYTVKSSGMTRISRYAYPDLLDMLGAQPQIFKQMLNSICTQLKDFWARAGAQAGIAPELYYLGDIRSYGPDQWVIREGEDDTEIFRIVSADKGLEVSRGGHKLAVLENPGDFFGEMASVLEENRTASVRSLGNSILEVYPGSQLQNILTDYPEVAMGIITALSKRLAETTRALTRQG